LRVSLYRAESTLRGVCEARGAAGVRALESGRTSRGLKRGGSRAPCAAAASAPCSLAKRHALGWVWPVAGRAPLWGVRLSLVHPLFHTKFN
jgi:hypothetical protein